VITIGLHTDTMSMTPLSKLGRPLRRRAEMRLRLVSNLLRLHHEMALAPCGVLMCIYHGESTRGSTKCEHWWNVEAHVVIYSIQNCLLRTPNSRP
jgi:hypothetical protein